MGWGPNLGAGEMSADQPRGIPEGGLLAWERAPFICPPCEADCVGLRWAGPQGASITTAGTKAVVQEGGEGSQQVLVQGGRGVAAVGHKPSSAPLWSSGC